MINRKQLTLDSKLPYLYSFCGLFAGVLLVSSPYVSWDPYSRILFALLTGYIAYKAVPLFFDGSWKQFAPTVPKRIVLSAIILYAAFACTYNQIVMETVPWAQDVNIGTFAFVFLWLIFWLLAAFAFLQGFEKLQMRFVGLPDRQEGDALHKPSHMLLWFRVFGIIMLGFSFWLIASFPANMSSDSIDQWEQALGVRAINDWHPAIHTLLIRLSIVLVQSPFAPVLVQSLIISSIYATVFVYLKKMGLSEKILYGAAVIIAIVPSNGVYAATLWKDVAFAIAMLAFAVSLLKLTSQHTQKRLWINDVLLVVAVFLVASLRHNGVVPAFVGAALASIFLYRKARRVIPFIGLVLVLFMKSFIYPAMNISPTPDTLSMGVPTHAIASVFARDGKLDEQYKDTLTDSVPIEKWVEDYHPFTPNTMLFPANPPSVMSGVNHVDRATIIGAYIDGLIRNPVILLRHHLSNSDIQWAVFHGRDPAVFNSRHGKGVYENRFGIEQSYNDLHPISNSVLSATSQFTITDVFLWRSGIYIVLIFLLAYMMWLKKTFKHTLIVAPVIANFLASLIFNGSQDYRYTYQVFLCFPVIALYFLAVSKGTAQKEGEPEVINENTCV